jgi:hypothetical protein
MTKTEGLPDQTPDGASLIQIFDGESTAAVIANSKAYIQGLTQNQQALFFTIEDPDENPLTYVSNALQGRPEQVEDVVNCFSPEIRQPASEFFASRSRSSDKAAV